MQQERELLAWRALFAAVTAQLPKPDAIERIKQVLAQNAPQLEGQIADRMWWEYVTLKTGGGLTVHSIHEHPVPTGVMVISYCRQGLGWAFSPNEWTGSDWRRPGPWSHWGHMVLVPTNGPDGHPVLFDECEKNIATAKLVFEENEKIFQKKVFYEMALKIIEIYFHLVSEEKDKKFLQEPVLEKFLQSFENVFGFGVDDKAPRYPDNPISALTQLMGLMGK